MMQTQQTGFVITGDITPFQRAMSQLAGAAQAGQNSVGKAFEGIKKDAQSSGNAISSQFKNMGDLVGGITGKFAAFTAVFAAGGALKKFISEANEWNGAAGKMAGQLGISIEKASVLNVALAGIGMESADYLDATKELTNKLREDASSFTKLGVSVKDAQGNYRPMNQIMEEVNAKLLSIKNPIEQNIAGTKIYGERWNELRGVLKITSQSMADAEVRARELGLIIGPENKTNTDQYKQNMRDLNLVTKAIEIQFGQQLLPVFSRTGAWLAKEGPQAGVVFGRVIEGIGFAAMSTWMALNDMGDGLGALAAQSAALLRGDLAGFKSIGAERDAQAAKNEASYEKMKSQLFGAGKPTAALPADPGVNNSGGRINWDKEKQDAKTRVAIWEESLAQQKAAIARGYAEQGQLREMSKDEELQYWRGIQSAQRLSAAERATVTRKVAELEQTSIKQQLEVKLAALDAEAAKYKNNTDEQMRIQRQIMAIHTQGTKEYEAASKRMQEIERAAAEQHQQIEQIRAQASRDAQLHTLAMQEQAAQAEQQAGIISQGELLRLQTEFEQRRYLLAQQALQERIALAQNDPDRNPVALAQLHAELEAKQREHELRMGQLRTQSTTVQQQALRDVASTAQTSWASALKGMATGSMTVGQGLKAIFAGLGNAVIDVAANVASKWLAQQLMMLVFGKTTAMSEISAEAAKAGAGGVASMAAAPFPLNLAAPEFGAAMSLAALSFAPMASAAGGYDIPRGLNPIVQAHAEEMILPAAQANVIRQLAQQPEPSAMQQAASTSGAAATTIRGMPPGDWLMVHSGDLVRALQAADRNFVIKRR